MNELTPTFIMALIGSVIAVVFEYLPGLEQAYGKLEDDKQRLVMLGVILLVVAGAYALSCAGVLAYFPCTQPGLLSAGELFLATLVANQATHRILPKPQFFRK
jgi:hypothetical protein